MCFKYYVNYRLSQAEDKYTSIMRQSNNMSSVKDFERFYKFFKHEVYKKRAKKYTVKLRIK